MKTKPKLLGFLLLINAALIAQPIGTPPANNIAAQSTAAWYRGGNVSSTTPAFFNIFGFTDLGAPSIWHQTEGFSRLLMQNGNGSANAGRIAIGNNIPGNFAPTARLHLLQFGIGNNGSMFRTDGDNGVNNNWQLFTGTGVNTVTEKFRLSSLAFTNNVIMQTIQNGYMALHTNQRQRIYIDDFTGTGLGCVGIGTPMFSPSQRPASYLHIQQDNNNGSWGGGFRNWMSPSAVGTYNGGTGMMISNGDNIWLGLKNKNGNFDENDAVLNWGDNGGTQAPSADYMRFVFTSYGGGASNQQLGENSDGLEIMRMAPNSFVGIGDWNVTSQLQPRSKLHIHENVAQHTYQNQIGKQSVWLQITNSDYTPNPQTNDGIRLGLNYNLDTTQTSNAFLYNQENRHLIFSTAHAAPDLNQATNERVRITSISAPTDLPAPSLGTYGVYNPANISNKDITRVSISHNPADPVTRPLSLMHLGYNADKLNIGTNDGWRPWMDIGTYTTNGYDNMYFGLKKEASNPGLPNDHHDAVIAWGDNQTQQSSIGPDVMRFIFATNQSGFVQGDSTSKGKIGLEVMRLYPNRDTLGKYGRVGIGNFHSNGLAQQPTHKLDVDGNIRARLLPDTLYRLNANTANNAKVMFVDSMGVHRWEYLDSLKIKSSGGGIGNYCGDTLNPLQGDYEVRLNGNNYFFTDSITAPYFQNFVSIGNPCGTTPIAKLEVTETLTPNTPVNIYGLKVNQLNIANNNTFYTGSSYAGHFRAVRPNRENIGVYGEGIDGQQNFGGRFHATSPYLAPNTSLVNVGSDNNASNARTNVAVRARAVGGNSSTGGTFQASNGTTQNYGINCDVTGGTTGANNIAVFGIAPSYVGSNPPGTVFPNNYAGYFTGTVVRTGTDNFSSDGNLKHNIDSIQNADAILRQLKPKSFEFKTSQYPFMSLPTGKQFGLIAQEAETVIPELVSNILHPERLDTNGNQISPAMPYKTLNYTGLIPFLIKGYQEQAAKVDSLKDKLKKVDSLESLYNQLAQQIASCCQSNNANTANNFNNTLAPENKFPSYNVSIGNDDLPMLAQNIPNPYGNTTNIQFNIPKNAQSAQIVFFNEQGMILNSVEINTKGRGQINLNAEKLENGLYFYSLIIDGKKVDTKKMVKAE